MLLIVGFHMVNFASFKRWGRLIGLYIRQKATETYNLATGMLTCIYEFSLFAEVKERVENFPKIPKV